MMTLGLPRQLRVGFIGVGWIGLNRMMVLGQYSDILLHAVFEPNETARAYIKEQYPEIQTVGSIEHLLDLSLDAVVIASPSGLHAVQAIAALERGIPVFCQKPLAITRREALNVVVAAKRNDCLIEVDMSYRYLRASQEAKGLIQNGELGEIYALNLQFHNAYGPDKEWYYQRRTSGGGCLPDLGTHLVDLALWLLDTRPAESTISGCYNKGQLTTKNSLEVEDFAAASFFTREGCFVNLFCSWNLPVSYSVKFDVAIYGTEGVLHIRNVADSYYDFELVSDRSDCKKHVVKPPDEWGGRAITSWASRVANDPSFKSSAFNYVATVDLLDRVKDSSMNLSSLARPSLHQGSRGNSEQARFDSAHSL